MKNINKEALVADVLDVNWTEVLAIEECDPNFSFERLDKKINEITDVHAPLKKKTKKTSN